MRGSAKHIGEQQRASYQRKHPQHHGSKVPAGEQNDKEFRKVTKMKKYLEDESSLFKDIERSSAEYQDSADPLNINVESVHTDTAPIDVEDIQLVERGSSQKSRSRSGDSRKKLPKHHQTSIQSTEHRAKRFEVRDEDKDAKEH